MDLMMIFMTMLRDLTDSTGHHINRAVRAFSKRKVKAMWVLPQGGKCRASGFRGSRLADWSRGGHDWGEVCVAGFRPFASSEIDMNRRQALLGLFALPAVAQVAT